MPLPESTDRVRYALFGNYATIQATSFDALAGAIATFQKFNQHNWRLVGGPVLTWDGRICQLLETSPGLPAELREQLRRYLERS